ncbi:MAG: HD domain-containing protein [Lachnospiraceae bacterium]|nr:HD domain-containing protein [Lachnospiraceae bacterium]
MKFIKDLKEGDKVFDIYLCKHKTSAVTKNGKPYETATLQDKTGTIEAKIWDPNNAGINDFEAMDYVEVYGDVNSFQGALQLNVKRTRCAKAGEYDPKNYLPVSRYGIEDMYGEVQQYINAITNPYLLALCRGIFVEDKEFVEKFKVSSAAKTVHHGFMGGLLEHTLGVVKLCEFYCTRYKKLNKDLLITAALCHDIGKVRELSAFPMNDYTDEGNFLGHIVMGTEMVGEKIREIEGFPVRLASELKHCILSHHGEFEFGSPKKPAIIEAVALNFADNTDAKMETFTELLNNASEKGWLGFNRLLDTNVTATRME